MSFGQGPTIRVVEWSNLSVVQKILCFEVPLSIGKRVSIRFSFLFCIQILII